MSTRLLAGDIGGTKTHLAIFAPDQGPRTPIVDKVYPSGQYQNLETIAKEFLAETGQQVESAVFGVAGPVVGGQATITNLPWIIREHRLQEVLDIPSVTLLNDLQAIAYSIPNLDTEDVHTLNDADADPEGPIAVIAPGTGLGEAYLTWNTDGYRAHASEGGHTDFGPTDALEVGLLNYMMQRFDHVSYEKVCSGLGIANLYAYLKDTGCAPEPPWLAKALVIADDPNPVIVNAALRHDEKSCELCETTLRLFVSILGAEAGNLALKLMSTGGVYLGGGIPPRILPWLENKYFMQAFLNKGRFSTVLIRIPVHVIMNRDAALLGVACYGLRITWHFGVA
ncbi:MAG: glucokinase [Chloroflexota bacterium]|nr:glucokinase [Chloroflexota bacterium]